MIIPLSEHRGFNHGCDINHSPSFGGHLRPLNHNSGATHIVRPSQLHPMGRGLGASGDTGNFCNFRLSYGKY